MQHGPVRFTHFLAAVLSMLLHVSYASPNLIAVVLACSRTSQLKKTLRSFASAASSQQTSVPVYVSVDEHPKAYRAVRAAEGEPNVAGIWRHKPSPDYAAETTRDRIARHYYFALSNAFNESRFPGVTHVLVLEDDLLFAPDFLSFVQAAASHLSDAAAGGVVCASAWNDNGRVKHASQRRASLTSFFPGLGWVLSRTLWESHLGPRWPGAPGASPRAIVGIGWDFWLRQMFEAQNWLCVTPDVPRVLHFGGSGANVGAREAGTLFAESRLADVARDEVDWDGEVARAVDVRAAVEEVQMWLRDGVVVRSVEEARKSSGERVLLPFRREDFREQVGLVLGLWPTPRGHFRHTLLVRVTAEREVLLYDERRAGRHFAVAGAVAGAAAEARATVVLGKRGASCDEACAAGGLRCEAAALEVANSCESVATVAKDRCRLGCAYETGCDLPARVEDEAPLRTAGLCLVAETGLGDDGRLDCAGRYEWTRRACGCVAGGDAGDGAARGAGRDEL